MQHLAPYGMRKNVGISFARKVFRKFVKKTLKGRSSSHAKSNNSATTLLPLLSHNHHRQPLGPCGTRKHSDFIIFFAVLSQSQKLISWPIQPSPTITNTHKQTHDITIAHCNGREGRYFSGDEKPDFSQILWTEKEEKTEILRAWIAKERLSTGIARRRPPLVAGVTHRVSWTTKFMAVSRAVN
jgi:hypothetical protein